VKKAAQPSQAALPLSRDRVLEVGIARLGQIPTGTAVRITGTVRPLDGLLTSPVEQRPCIAYRLVVDEPGWRQVLDCSGCASFLVVSGGASVMVRGPFSVLLQSDYRWDFGEAVQVRLARLLEASTPVKPPPRILSHLTGGRSYSRPRAVSANTYDQNYRYFEALLRPGMPVIVEGVTSTEIDPMGERATLRDPPLRGAVIASPDRPVTVSLPWPGALGW
jgi:hypothetical protein